jgi:predicted MPP superfamily phosphohydrolase
VLDFIFIGIFLFVQWWISGALRGRGVSPAVVAIFNAVAAAGFACAFSDLVNLLNLQGASTAIAGAIGLGYTLVAGFVIAVYVAIGRVRHHFGARMRPDRRRVLSAVSHAAAAVPLAAIGYGFVQRTDFHVREIDLPIAGLPPDLEGLRILQLSDIHLSPFLSESQLARVIDSTAGLHPHLALITGDLISQAGDPLDACIRQLARVKADAGMFGCMGNHERYARCEAYTEQASARAGIPFLRRSARQLRFGNAVLNLAGVDHQPISQRNHYLKGADRLIVPGATNVLLSHNPDVFPVAARQGYNLVLSGHTHGGQVTVDILDQSINPARFITPYVYGVYRAGTATAYVTRGIGTIGIPARIGAPPEISLLRLRKA